MLQELAEMLEKTQDIEKIVIDNYVMEHGVYFKIDFNGNILNKLVVNKNTDKTCELYRWFKIRDYHSKLISMNKPVYKDKKIHSNNIFSLFIKLEILPVIGKADKALSQESVEMAFDNHFNKLESEPDKENKKILSSCDMKPMDLELSKKCRNALELGLKSAIERISKEESKLKYLKLFIVSSEDELEDENNYSREGQRYVLQNIFNNSKNILIIKDKFMGPSYNNMQLNGHKPYLKMKNTKYEVPYRISLEQAFINKSLFEWLESCVKKNDKPIMNFNIPYGYNFNEDPNDYAERGLFIEAEANKNGIIVTDCNNLPRNIKYLNKPFEYKIFIDSIGDKCNRILERTALEKLIDTTFFRNCIAKMYYNSKDKLDKFSNFEINAMKIISIPMKNYFRLGVENELAPILDKITLSIIMGRIRGGEISFKRNNADKDAPTGKKDTLKSMTINSIKKALNVRLNLLRYFKKEGEETVADVVIDVANRVRNMILSKEGDAVLNDDREFYYCVGQLTYYLCDRSRAANKKMDMFTPVLEAKNPERIKKFIEYIDTRYSYDIGFNNLRYKRTLRAVMGYEANTKPMTDLILCGICDNNIIYTKTDEEVKDNEVSE